MGEQNLEILNKLFLELSLVVSSDTMTAREIGMAQTLARVRSLLVSVLDADYGDDISTRYTDLLGVSYHAVNVIDGLDQ